MCKRIKTFLTTTTRLAAGIAIIAWIFRKLDLPALKETLQGCFLQWPWILAGTVLAGAVLLTGAVRWRMILTARRINLRWEALCSIYLIGHFFNAFMLGLAGGDLARAFYLRRAAGCGRTEALASVLADRIGGMLVIYCLAVVMMACNAGLFWRHWELHLPALLMLALIASGVAMLLLLYNARRFKNWPIFAFVKRRPELERVLRNFWEVFELFRTRPKFTLQTSAISLLAQLLLVGECYCLGRSLRIPLGFGGYLAVVPVIMSLAAVPITPGGLGVREALSVTMLGALGIVSARSLPFSLMIYAVGLFWSLLGGLVFMSYSAGHGGSLRGEVAEFEAEVAREAGELGVSGAHQQ